jgi:hypothetical protein
MVVGLLIPCGVNVRRIIGILPAKTYQTDFSAGVRDDFSKQTYEVILVIVVMSACFFSPAHVQTESGTIRAEQLN